MNKITNRHSVGYTKERYVRNMERKNPLQKIVRLINQYWSIDLLHGTKEEKDWAKKRLYGYVMKELRNVSPDIHGQIKASLTNKDIWESTREILS